MNLHITLLIIVHSNINNLTARDFSITQKKTYDIILIRLKVSFLIHCLIFFAWCRGQKVWLSQHWEEKI